MADSRADPLGDLDLSDFDVKPAKRPAVPKETIRTVSEAHQFPSRSAPTRAAPPAAPAKPVREQRRYRTGRNVQFAAKVTQDTYDQAYGLLAQLGPRAVMGELLEQAFAALARDLAAAKKK